MTQDLRHLAATVVSLFTCALVTPAGPLSRVDDSGKLDRIALGEGWARVSTDVRVYSQGWSKSVSLSTARDLKAATNGEARLWTATLAPDSGAGAAVRLVQTARYAADGKVAFHLKATGEREGDIEGVLFLVNLPAEDFASGTLQTSDKTTSLPEKLPEPIHLWHGHAGKMVFTNRGHTVRVAVEASPALSVTVQDGRKWAQEFTAMIYLRQGNLAKGQSVEATITLAAEGHVDQTPGLAFIDPAKVLYTVTGMGGNYCFNIESPVTQHTLDHLRVRAARTEMSLKLWAPRRVPGDLAGTDYQPYAIADTPDSRIRRELELMQTIQRKGIPYTISVWRMPSWLGELVSREGWQERWRITTEGWPSVLQATGAYLLYAKEKYQVEPDYFSFNESNYGVDVLMTAEEHRDAIKRLGAHFAKLGLKTRLLLGDVAGPRDTHAFAEPAARDPEAMKYVGAVSFHSWGGAEPGQYAAWAELADRVKRPLIVAEAGPDSAAWRTRAYASFPYAVREMTHYQELLLHARPQSILYWEFTGDYSLLEGAVPDSAGRLLSERFCLQKHWCDLILPGGEALATRCETDGVLVTAFRSGAHLTVHISNSKWARPITLSGLPEGLNGLKIIRTAQSEYYRNLGAARVREGRTTLVLPAESLTTLTTLDWTEAPPMKAR